MCGDSAAVRGCAVEEHVEVHESIAHTCVRDVLRKGNERISREHERRVLRTGIMRCGRAGVDGCRAAVCAGGAAASESQCDLLVPPRAKRRTRRSVQLVCGRMSMRGTR